MKILLPIVSLIILLGAAYYFFNGTQTATLNDNDMTTPTQADASPVQVIPIEHASGVLLWSGATIYFDPVGADMFASQPPADIVLLTDVHGDHLSTTTLAAVVGSSTSLIVPQAVKEMLPPELSARAKVLANDASIIEKGFTIRATPMYNLPGAENKGFHTKGRGNGYIIEKSGFRAYIAGDTAGTPEMRALTGIDLAFVPMNLPYTMDVEEAADAVLAFAPRVVYPYHYRGPDGLSDVAKFKELVDAKGLDIGVILADWYPKQ